jgi:hypothetical protein
MAHQFPTSPSEILHLYCRVLDRFFGMYIDACGGFKLYAENMSMMARTMPATSRALPILFIGSEVNDPNDPDATYNHSETVDKVIERNQPNGENQLLLSQALIVFIYSIWDSEIRPAYSKALGMEQKDVKSDAMGDLRLYRNAIIHSNLKLQMQTKKFPFVSVGNAIALKEDQVNAMLAMIFDDLAQMHERLTGEKFTLRFQRPMNKPSP